MIRVFRVTGERGFPQFMGKKIAFGHIFLRSAALLLRRKFGMKNAFSVLFFTLAPIRF
jgi:hypothetical protein